MNYKYYTTRNVIFILSLIVYSSSLCFAQTADDIIAKYINAMGGKDKLLSIKNVYMEGSTDMNGAAMAIKSWLINKKAARYEFTLNGMTSYYIITNDSGWQFIPMMGQKQAEPVTQGMVRSAQSQLDPEGLLLDYKANGYTVEYKGKDDVEGTPAYKIMEKVSDSLSDTYYIDTANYYILRIATKAVADGKHLDISRDFSNYQKTPDGYLFPFSMSTGMGLGEFKLTSVKINIDMDPSLFKPKR